jgi:ABC-2 type transport system ATP-binding protein
LSKFYYVKASEDSIEEHPGAIKVGKKLEIRAVKNVSFSLSSSGVVGLVGVNGAGKSTLIKLMTGILTPTSGEIKIFDRDPYKYRIKNNMRLSAVFGQRSGLLWDLPVSDSYELLRRMYRVPLKNYEEYISGISKLLSRPVRTLSLAQKMLAELCAAFIHDPEIVFLDEPTI